MKAGGNIPNDKVLAKEKSVLTFNQNKKKKKERRKS
jgi:hypothetical protein